jgi:glycosyltransferase involved in cell wall biosynthesis
MKIALLAPASAFHTQKWANGLAAEGHNVSVLSLHKNSLLYDKRVKVLTVCPVCIINYIHANLLVLYLRFFFKVDIIHAHYASSYGLLAATSPFINRYLLSIWGSDVYEFPFRSRLHRFFLSFALNSPTKIFSTSKAMKKHVIATFGTQVPIEIIPFGVCLPDLLLKRKLNAAKGNSFVVGTIKTMSHVYGIDTLVHSFHLLSKDTTITSYLGDRKLRLVIIGGGSDYDKLQALVTCLGLEEMVTLHGRIDNKRVYEYMAGFDIFAALSRRESFGVAMLEASACSLPVVSTTVGGIPEVVVQNKTGILVSPDSPVEAYEALRQIILNPGFGKQLGSNGRLFVERNYLWDSCLKTLLSEYETFISYR